MAKSPSESTNGPTSPVPLEGMGEVRAPRRHQAPFRTIGIIGGISWESTATYYSEINREVRRLAGGMHTAPIAMQSVEYAEIHSLQHDDAWDELGELMLYNARALQRAGADGIVLAANTMHLVDHYIEDAIDLPLLHIADCTADAVQAQGLRCVGLLGTRFTMDRSFLRDRLSARHGASVLLPSDKDRETVHNVIFDELCHGVVSPASRDAYRRVIERLVERGAEGVILGCTEIGRLLSAGDTHVPLFDTALIHARAAAEWCVARV